MNRMISPQRIIAEPAACCSDIEQRMLIPVKEGDDALQAVAYAIRRRAEGVRVAVCLLHVEASGAVLRECRVRSPVPRIGTRREVFSGCMQMLSGLDIEYSAYVRNGPVVFTILDVAEELDCSEIVLPAPSTGIFRIFSRNVVTLLQARQCSIPVVTVCRDGIAVPAK